MWEPLFHFPTVTRGKNARNAGVCSHHILCMCVSVCSCCYSLPNWNMYRRYSFQHNVFLIQLYSVLFVTIPASKQYRNRKQLSRVLIYRIEIELIVIVERAQD